MAVPINISDAINSKAPELMSNNQYAERYKVNSQCASAIMKFYMSESRSFKAYAALKTGGIDTWSKTPVNVLEDTAGSSVTACVKEYFTEAVDVKTCLRWICRGLRPEDAIRKVLGDKEISANCSK